MKLVGLVFHLCLLLVLGLHKQAQAEQGQPQGKESATSTSSIGFSADVKKQILPYVQRCKDKIATTCNHCNLYYYTISYVDDKDPVTIVIDKKKTPHQASN